MDLLNASLSDLMIVWTVVFTLAFTPIALVKAANDLVSIAKALALAGGVAVAVAPWFAGPMWVIIQVAS